MVLRDSHRELLTGACVVGALCAVAWSVLYFGDRASHEHDLRMLPGMEQYLVSRHGGSLSFGGVEEMACNLIESVSASPVGPLVVVIGSDVTIHGAFIDDGGVVPCEQGMQLAKRAVPGLWSATGEQFTSTSGVGVNMTWEPLALGNYEFKVTAQYCAEGWSGGLPLGDVVSTHDSNIVEVRVVGHYDADDVEANGPARSFVTGGQPREGVADGESHTVDAAQETDQSSVVDGPTRSVVAGG